jgi:RHS repeat-associated protein
LWSLLCADRPGTRQIAYDANGNMTARASATQNVTWSSDNYPLAISATDATGNEEVQLFYGPERQRWKAITTEFGSTENTFYVGGLVDIVYSSGTNYRHYIYAGGEPVAVYSRTAAGVNTMSYMLEDHQGGVSNIASKSGTSDVNESFSAFGTRRNPATWSGAPTTADLNTIAGLSRQGYTMQTWLGQSMGLNHMNGRVEDAILGRFLSPDPHITDPSNAQNYNRYSYVINNPLTMSDPSGFDTFCDDSGCTVSAGGGGDAPAPDEDPGLTVGAPDLIPPTVAAPPVPDPVAIEPDIPEVVVTAPKLSGASADPFNIPSIASQLPSFPLPAPVKIQGQSNNPITPCPSGTLSNFAYALHDFGMNSMKTGTAGAVLAQNGLIAAAPYAETPAGADAVLVNEALGLASDFTFVIGATSAAIGGGYLAFNGDRNPLNATTTTLAQTIGEDAARVPNLSPTDPLDAPFESMGGPSTCSKK